MSPLSDDPAKSSVVLDRALDQEKSLDPSGPSHKMSTIHFGRPARTTAGLVPAATHGTRSKREECAPPASTSGPQPSAFFVPAGRRIPIGMRSYELQTRCVFVVYRP